MAHLWNTVRRHIRLHQESISQMRKTCSSIHIISLTPPQKEDFSNGILNFMIYYWSHFFIYILSVRGQIIEMAPQLVLRFPGNINLVVKRLWHFALAKRFPARTSIIREIKFFCQFHSPRWRGAVQRAFGKAAAGPATAAGLGSGQTRTPEEKDRWHRGWEGSQVSPSWLTWNCLAFLTFSQPSWPSEPHFVIEVCPGAFHRWGPELWFC